MKCGYEFRCGLKWMLVEISKEILFNEQQINYQTKFHAPPQYFFEMKEEGLSIQTAQQESGYYYP